MYNVKRWCEYWTNVFIRCTQTKCFSRKQIIMFGFTYTVFRIICLSDAPFVCSTSMIRLIFACNRNLAKLDNLVVWRSNLCFCVFCVLWVQYLRLRWLRWLWTSCVCWWRSSGAGCALKTFRGPSNYCLGPSSTGNMLHILPAVGCHSWVIF